MQPGIRVRGLPGCPSDVLEAVQRAARAVRRVSRARGPVSVLVSPALTIPDPHDGESCYGWYLCGQIRIAAGSVAVKRALGQSDTEAMADVIDTLLHELVHAEQETDGRPQTERGVKVRVRSLMRCLS